MPRVHKVQKARKARPQYGIEIGDSYYWWAFRYGGKRYSKTFPRPSQLTQSRWGDVYAIQEELEDFVAAHPNEWESIAEACQTAASGLDDVASEYMDGVSNMPENLQNSQTAYDMEEKANSLEQLARELEEIAYMLESNPEEGEEDSRSIDDLESLDWESPV